MNIKKLLDKTTLKFIVVGVINTLIGTTVMFLLYNLADCNYWVSSAANYIVGSIVSFVLNKYFTFKNNEKSIKQIFIFTINILICYLLAYGIAKPLVSAILSTATLTTSENIAMLAGSVIFIIFNYIGQRFIVFKQQEN